MKKENRSDLESESQEIANYWDCRQFSYSKVIRCLFKKQFLLKFRVISSIIEFLVACVIFLILFPIQIAATETFPTNRTQTIEYNSDELPIGLLMFLFVPNTKIFMMPQTKQTNNLVNTIFKPIFTNANISIPIEFCEKAEDIQNLINSADLNALGINFNIENKRTPKIETYIQNLFGNPNRDLFFFLTKFTVGEVLMMDFTNPRLYKFLTMNISSQQYPQLERKEEVNILFFFMLVSSLPIIISFMPDFQTVLTEKESKVASLFFLMGLPETIYWLVNFITPIVLSFIPYFLMCLSFSFWFYLKGTDFGVLIVLSLLYIIAQINFQYFLSAFMKTSESGRSTTITMLMIAIFFCFVDGFYTLAENNKTEWAKHLFSIIPIAAYQMGMGTAYTTCYKSQPPVSWSRLSNIEYQYQPWWAFVYLICDSIIYFCLFLLFNAINEREFGIAPLSSEMLFSIPAWKDIGKSSGNTKKKISNSNSSLDNCPNNGLVLEDVDLTNVHRKLITIYNLNKKYNKNKGNFALKKLNLEINEGEITIVIGPNGAGKSTLINILSGMTKPSNSGQLGSHRLIFDGNDSTFKKAQCSIGAVFQSNVFIDLLSTRENLELFGTIRGLDDQDLKDSIEKVVAMLQLESSIDVFAKDLSGGQKRKLCIAISMLGDPPIRYMDEPTAGVDLMSKFAIWKTIANMKNVTALITTHTLEEAESVMSRLFVLDKGELKFNGTADEMRKSYQCGYILKFETIEQNVHQNERSNYTSSSTSSDSSNYSEDDKKDDKDENDDKIENDDKDKRNSKKKKKSVGEKVMDLIPDSTLLNDKTITFPATDGIADILESIDDQKEKLGIASYTLSIELLEDVLMKLLSREKSEY